MQLKDNSVRVGGISTGLLFAALVVERVLLEFEDLACIITSARDGKHGWGSLHFSGNAFDVRTKLVPRDQLVEFVTEVATRLAAKAVRIEPTERSYAGPEFDVLLEDIDGENEHLHVEFQPKTA